MKTTLKQVVNIYNSNRELFWDEIEVLGIEHDYVYNCKIHDEVEIWWLDPWENCLSNWLFTKILN